MQYIILYYPTFEGDCPPSSIHVTPSLNPSPRGRDLLSLQAVKNIGVSQMRNLSSSIETIVVAGKQVNGAEVVLTARMFAEHKKIRQGDDRVHRLTV